GIPRQLAGFDELTNGHGGEHLACRRHAEFRLVVDWYAEAAVGQTTAFVEHRFAAISDRHAAGEIVGTYQAIERHVDQMLHLRMRDRRFGPVGIHRRIIHWPQLRAPELAWL